jgi:hypothetical protein
MDDKLPSLPPRPENRKRTLVELRVRSWPFPDDDAIANETLRAICEDIVNVLAVNRWRKHPAYRRPSDSRGDAQARGVSAAEAAGASEPYCWIESYYYTTCDCNGAQVPCRIEHWICDDGTWFDREILFGCDPAGVVSAPAEPGA